MTSVRAIKAALAGAFGALFLAACSPTSFTNQSFTFTDLMAPSAPAESSVVSAYASPTVSPIARFNGQERECLMRAMYFESNRSSSEGMLAVGTVVMNRVESTRFPNSVCGVVGAPRQFASGVLSRPMTEPASEARAASIADRVLSGERHPGVRTAKFFHQAGLRFNYGNMHYVLEAGGNEFYIKS